MVLKTIGIIVLIIVIIGVIVLCFIKSRDATNQNSNVNKTTNNINTTIKKANYSDVYEAKHLMDDIFEKIDYRVFEIRYSELPPSVYNLTNEARDLKRKGEYVAAIRNYIKGFYQLGYIPSEMARMLCKTLVCLNLYVQAVSLLLQCGAIEVEYVKMDPNYYHAPCLMNCQELVEYVKLGAKGNIEPLIKRTKEYSGNSNYQPVQTREDIIELCRVITNMLNQ